MSTAIKIRNSVISGGVIFGGTYLLYKMIMPSNKNDGRKAKGVVHEVDLDEGEAKGPGAGSAIGTDQTSRNFRRVIELSQQGYTYEAITKIIGNEQKRRYQALYAREEYERKQALETQRAAEWRIPTLPTINTTDAIESAVQAIASKT